MQADESIKEAANVLRGAEGLLVITGAGISAESGVATFRGPNGVLTKHPELEAVLCAAGLMCDPEGVWRFIDEFRVQAAGVVPNEAHRVLAKWEREGLFGRFLIATQNIDGLHQAAGSRRVSELHGSAWQMARPRQKGHAEDEGISEEFRQGLAGEDAEEVLRKWSAEDGQEVWENREVPFGRIPPYADPEVRPNVLLFDEAYGRRLLWVRAFIDKKPEAVLVIGCSGAVTILDHLLGECRHANRRCRIINLNAYESGIGFKHVDVRMSAVEGMKRLDEALH
jgi:NAD-dependent SIR2 family protein deacetylase